MRGSKTMINIKLYQYQLHFENEDLQNAFRGTSEKIRCRYGLSPKKKSQKQFKMFKKKQNHTNQFSIMGIYFLHIYTH